MTQAQHNETASILDFVMKQRAHVLSFREWKHRLAGFGFSIDETDKGPVLAKLPSHRMVCALPAEFCA
ncbi:hypothetical protein [Aliiroseovarius subalbicans]|uniref:hypothetical protein n=1 Tax=Aliiroseovarius subalbicans TaxID=2925840 RepID=UPI001F57F5CF|nr:hypothetical protein [Aliiroseovarius subalbicans]MCI2399869.1 hypothetical protein [Aliiroseovarius subalbicans]